MKVSRRFGGVAAVAAVTLFGAVACSSGGGGSTSPNKGTTSAAATTTSTAASTGSSSAGAVDITSKTVDMDVFNYDDGVQAWADSTTKAFNALSKGYSLKITVVPTTSLQQQLTTRVQGGNPPDISSMPTAWMPAFEQANAIVDVSTLLSPDFLGKFDKTLMSGSYYNGKLYSLPYGSSARALFYNKDAYTKAGITDPPKTWDELIQDAKKLMSSGATKYGMALQGTGNETFSAWFPYFYWSYGGDFGTGTTLKIDQNACVAAMTQLNKIVRVDKITEPNVTANDFPQVGDLFTSKQVGMTIDGPWLTTKDFNYGVAPIPAGTTQATLGVTDGWAVFDKAKASKGQIAEVLQFLMSEPIEVPFVQGRGFLPVLTADFSNSAFTGPTVKPFVDMLAKAKFAPLSPSWTGLIDKCANAMQSMSVDGTSPENTCKTIASSAG
jgi:multiple sugar transport system substrate-binding protein